MTALHEIQAAFIHDIYTGERTSLAYLDIKDIYAARLDIYQNNTILGLTDVLTNAFPILKKIAGEDFFKTIARHYIKDHPQPSGNRHDFGSNLAVFLHGFKPVDSLPYLPDIASLEWAYFQAALADDKKILDFKTLSTALSADPAFALSVHPSVFIVPQIFNALDIWQEHQKNDIGFLQLKSEPHQLMIWRGPDDVVLIRRASDAFLTLVVQSQNGVSFTKAMTIVGESISDMPKFQQEFAEAISLGVFSQTGREMPHV